MPPRVDLRLFVAAYPPVDLVGRAMDILRALDPAPSRPTPPEQVHLTLLFIGDTPARELGGVRESVARSAAGLPAFTLAPRRLITLPQRGRPRLVALETDADPTLLEIVRRLVKRLSRRPRAQEADRFLPHMTLCRFSHTGDPRPISVDADLPPFTVDRVALVRSDLLPGGAVHREVESFPLGIGGQ